MASAHGHSARRFGIGVGMVALRVACIATPETTDAPERNIMPETGFGNTIKERQIETSLRLFVATTAAVPPWERVRARKQQTPIHDEAPYRSSRPQGSPTGTASTSPVKAMAATTAAKAMPFVKSITCIGVSSGWERIIRSCSSTCTASQQTASISSARPTQEVCCSSSPPDGSLAADPCDASVKPTRPQQSSSAAAWSHTVYDLCSSSEPSAIVGRSLHDLTITFTGKETQRSATLPETSEAKTRAEMRASGQSGARAPPPPASRR
mmetsp:Transcript_8164/g.26289  ORF Transcript_8164/g.26289 Transcript_8164/m.26289 type:complete len:267 (-) Transcript_8164:226-1026(-)